ncbi:MAG: glycosyltransferase family 8 protein [Acidimicrobiales bacterium]
MSSGNESTRIVLATDAGFLAPVACVLSMLDRLDPDLVVSILHDGVEAKDRERTTSHLRDGLRVEWIDVSEVLPRHLKGTSHFTRMSYARLICADAVPAHVERIVYLDGDVLIRRSLRPLLEVDLAQRPVGACIDLNATSAGLGLSDCTTFGMTRDTPYYNAGVLVVDTAAWRGERIAHRAIEFASEHPDDLQWADQDVINVLLGSRCHRLDAQWNLLWGGWGRRATRRRVGTALPPAELDRALSDPAIVHFAGSIKPWHPRYGGRLGSRWFDEWRQAAQKTAFAGELLGGRRERLTRLAWSPLVAPIDMVIRVSSRRTN